MTLAEINGVLGRLYPGGDWPHPFHLLRALLLVNEGRAPSEAARAVGTSPGRLAAIIDSRDPVAEVCGEEFAQLDPALVAKARNTVGQLLVGRAAELAFENIYRSRVQPHEFELRDLREGRTSTDYRVYNGGGHPLYRINVKFFRPAFRRSQEMVSLDTADCFPLATYKIFQALEKQVQEHLPYIFLIVGVDDLDPDAIAPMIRNEDVEFLARVTKATISGRRNLEDRILAVAVEERSPAFVAAYDRIYSAPWYVLSARRAEQLLHEHLFDRVFALRVPRFAQQWRNAELDMHFSLSQDLKPLGEFLDILRDQGPHVISVMLERGTV